LRPRPPFGQIDIAGRAPLATIGVAMSDRSGRVRLREGSEGLSPPNRQVGFLGRARPLYL